MALKDDGVEQCLRSCGRDKLPGSTRHFPGPIQFVTIGAITEQLSKDIVYPLTVKAHDVLHLVHEKESVTLGYS